MLLQPQEARVNIFIGFRQELSIFCASFVTFSQVSNTVRVEFNRSSHNCCRLIAKITGNTIIISQFASSNVAKLFRLVVLSGQLGVTPGGGRDN